LSDRDALREKARERVAHLLPNTTFDEFDDANTRMLVAITLLQRGEKELAAELFETIAAEGPQENENRHFAYVRSLVELAELDAEQEQFGEAESRMEEALNHFPESMSYMMSRSHLEVYLIYYRYRLGKRDQAHEDLLQWIRGQEARFQEMSPEDGRNLVGPGLCYGIHQQSLFYVEEGDWQRAVESFLRLRAYANHIDETGWEEAERLMEENRWEEAYQKLVDSTSYQAA
jgi:tetratricopeptide (TPR) repeat protein